VVERVHFTPVVESLKRGATSAYPGTDLDYTLRAFPNHHRALLAMSKLSRREGRSKPAGANYTIDCYFDRAIRFQPDDPMPHMLAGLHLAQSGKRSDAVPYLQRATELATDDPNLHYNLGLGYLEVGINEQALVHAKRAYSAGFPLPGLRDRLRALGAWQE
jgi:Flp pilus assembly protein TadD